MHVASRISETGSRWRCHCWHFPMFSILNCCMLHSRYHKLPLDGAVIGTFWTLLWFWLQVQLYQLDLAANTGNIKIWKGTKGRILPVPCFHCKWCWHKTAWLWHCQCGTTNVTVTMWQWQWSSLTKTREHRRACKQAGGRVIERNMQQRHRCVQNNSNKYKRQRQNT